MRPDDRRVAGVGWFRGDRLPPSPERRVVIDPALRAWEKLGQWRSALLRLWTRRQRTGCPAARRESLTAQMRSAPKWKTLAARTASAPASTAGTKCSSAPAPP